MRRSRISLVSLAAAAALALVAGCSGPALKVHSKPGEDDRGRVYVKPYRDGEARTLPAATPETFVGEMPTDWEIPADLLGGRAKVRIEYPDDTRHEADIQFHKSKDTFFRVDKRSRPKG